MKLVSDAALWWHPDAEENRARLLLDYVRALEEAQVSVTERNAICEYLYDPTSSTPGMRLRVPGKRDEWEPYENVIRAICRAAISRLASIQLRPVYVAVGATIERRQFARRASSFLEGELQRLRFQAARRRCIEHMVTLGDGWLQVAEEADRVKLRVHHPDNVLIDEEECVDGGTPTMLHVRQFVDRHHLAARYPEHADAIEKAHTEAQRGGNGWWTEVRRIGPHQVVLVESWRLPSAPGADDGRHTIAIDAAEPLVDEPWEREHFPLARWTWDRRPRSPYGIGLVEQLRRAQERLNHAHRFNMRAMDFIAVPRVFMSQADAQSMPRLDRTIGAIYPTRSGNPPTFLTPPALSSDVLQHPDRITEAMHRTSGVNQMAVSGVKPAGLESRAGLREYVDNTSMLHAPQMQADEEAVLEAAQLVMHTCAALSRRGVRVEALAADQVTAQRVDWDQLPEELGDYALRVKVASITSRTPAGIRADLDDMAASGLLGTYLTQQRPERILEALGAYDATSVTDEETAPAEDIHETGEVLLDVDGPMVYPEPDQDLEYGVRYLLSLLSRIRHDPDPKTGARCNRIRRWIEAALQTLADGRDYRAQLAALTAEPGAPGAPGAPGGNAPPVPAV